VRASTRLRSGSVIRTSSFEIQTLQDVKEPPPRVSHQAPPIRISGLGHSFVIRASSFVINNGRVPTPWALGLAIKAGPAARSPNPQSAITNPQSPASHKPRTLVPHGLQALQGLRGIQIHQKPRSSSSSINPQPFQRAPTLRPSSTVPRRKPNPESLKPAPPVEIWWSSPGLNLTPRPGFVRVGPGFGWLRFAA
jgi:hypothetical protein